MILQCRKKTLSVRDLEMRIVSLSDLLIAGIEELDDTCGGLGADAFDLCDFFCVSGAELFDRAEVFQQSMAFVGAEAFEIVEDRFAQFLAA